jgi:ATP-dependent DNA helicase Q1
VTAGKSLTYQLPAVLSEGTTLVISPLVALMADQNMHLKEAGVPAEMLNASTSRQDAALIMKRLLHSVVDQKAKRGSKSNKGKEKAHENDLAPIKLCYVCLDHSTLPPLKEDNAGRSLKTAAHLAHFV